MSVSQKKPFHLDDFEKAFYEAFANKSIGVGCVIERLRYWNKDDPSSEHHNAPRVGMAVTEPGEFDNGYQFGMVWEDSGTYATTEFGTYVLNERFEDGTKKWKIVGKEPRLEDLVVALRKENRGLWVVNGGIKMERVVGGPSETLAYEFGKSLMGQDRKTLEKILKAFMPEIGASKEHGKERARA